MERSSIANLQIARITHIVSFMHNVFLMGKLLEELDRDLDRSVPAEDICGGTLLSREQYLTDIQNLGRKDARLSPYGTLSANDADRWTAAIQQPKS